MITMQLEDKIKQNKEKLINKFPSLTEEDFEDKDNRKLLIHLQQKLGKTEDELRKIIKEV